jgi:large subunit ribosomal protein L22
MAEAFEIRAIARYIPITPQKARLVVDTVRGKKAADALDILRFLPKGAADPVFKVVQSAVANAEQNYGLEMEDLFVSKIFVDDGPRNRLRPYGGRFGSRGRFKPITKRSCHITVVLAEREIQD